MSELKSLGKLRQIAEKLEGRAMIITDRAMIITESDCMPLSMKLQQVADEIEREIAERFMELPKDRSGEVIRIGDKVWFHDEPDADPHIVRGYGMTNGHNVDVFVNHAGEGWCPNTVTVPDVLTHHRPRTLEDVLADFADEAFDVDGRDREEWEPLVERYAREIRELIGGAE